MRRSINFTRTPHYEEEIFIKTTNTITPNQNSKPQIKNDNKPSSTRYSINKASTPINSKHRQRLTHKIIAQQRHKWKRIKELRINSKSDFRDLATSTNLNHYRRGSEATPTQSLSLYLSVLNFPLVILSPCACFCRFHTGCLLVAAARMAYKDPSIRTNSGVKRTHIRSFSTVDSNVTESSRKCNGCTPAVDK